MPDCARLVQRLAAQILTWAPAPVLVDLVAAAARLEHFLDPISHFADEAATAYPAPVPVPAYHKVGSSQPSPHAHPAR